MDDRLGKPAGNYTLNLPFAGTAPRSPPSLGEAPGHPCETVRGGTNARPQISSHLCPPTQAVMYPCSCHAWACVRQLTPSHMDFNCEFWQTFVRPMAQFGAPGGFGITFWEFWRLRSDFDYESPSGGLFFSPEVKLRRNVAVNCKMEEICHLLSLVAAIAIVHQ